MKVLHIIPSAFNYFDDIRAKAFKLCENLNCNGVATDVIALQYGSQSKSEYELLEGNFPKLQRGESVSYDSASKDFTEYDLLHLHFPILGGVAEILSWKKNNSKGRLVVTYYRPVIFQDIFCLLIIVYCQYYFRKIMAASDVILVLSSKSAVHLTNFGDKVKLVDEHPVKEVMEEYNSIMNK